MRKVIASGLFTRCLEEEPGEQVVLVHDGPHPVVELLAAEVLLLGVLRVFPTQRICTLVYLLLLLTRSPGSRGTPD